MQPQGGGAAGLVTSRITAIQAADSSIPFLPMVASHKGVNKKNT